jgi:phosphotransferase system enzyme I (PtsI)
MAKERILKGIGVSKGICQGEVFVYETKEVKIVQTPIPARYLATEVERFTKALKKTEKELSNIKERINAEIGVDFAQFLDAQILMLKDREIIESVSERIKAEKTNAEYVYHKVLDEYAKKLGASRDQYLRERVADIWDVGMRVLRNLVGMTHSSVVDVPQGAVLVAHDISPSDAALINPNNVLGLAIEVGGRTSHTAITARALEVPAVVGVENLLAKVKNGEKVILDGNRGILIKSPTPGRIQFYRGEIKKEIEYQKMLSPFCELPAKTRDGRQLDISANIEFFVEYAHAKRSGAMGIGLFRTEFLYLTRRGNPSEEEQFRVYDELAKKMKPDPVIIRTYDLGGDKIFSDYHEANPFLGWRAIRVSLDDFDFFKIQLRAILRASVNRNIRVMYPMISTYEEIQKASRYFNEVTKELKKEKVDFDDHIQVGIMVETPSAAILSNQLAAHVDFFSIGSNDLTQYVLAVDRGNERVSHLFDHFHPAVLRLIKQVIDAGHRSHIWVGLCGELAADPSAIPLLVGLGIDELSMSPVAIPRAKMVLRALTVPECEKIAEKALNFRCASEVQKFLNRMIAKKFPGIGGIK